MKRTLGAATKIPKHSNAVRAGPVRFANFPMETFVLRKGGGAMKGSARKALGATAKHLTKAERAIKEQEEARIITGTEELMRPPAWLEPAAKKEWKRVVPQLLKIQVAGNLDLSAIAGYCQAFSKYQAVTKDLNGQSLLVLDPASGKLIENPLVKTQTTYAQEMRRFADMCGMSISARLKASAIQTNKVEDEIKADFGDI